jgi:phenylpropionate dioxygenase-like ring-hydroxylating dioxygenase large terminal subunit
VAAEFIRDEWYAAAWATDIGRTLLARRALGEDLVLYRTEAGQAVALIDRCAHRFAPLSLGTLKGDVLECGYHGICYDRSGACVRVPGQQRIPPGARVRSLPTHEKFGLVWIWPGDPALADPGRILDIPHYGAAGYGISRGYHHFESSYLNIADNLLDPAHTTYVHRGTIGNAAAEDVPVEAQVRDDVIVAGRWVDDAPPVPLAQRYAGLEGNVDRWQFYYLKPPCRSWVDFGCFESGLPHTPEEMARAPYRVLSYAMLTPETRRSTHYFWFQMRNFRADDESVSRELAQLYGATFDEDKRMLEAIQRTEDRAEGLQPMRIASDGGVAHFRRMIAARTAP